MNYPYDYRCNTFHKMFYDYFDGTNDSDSEEDEEIENVFTLKKVREEYKKHTGLVTIIVVIFLIAIFYKLKK